MHRDACCLADRVKSFDDFFRIVADLLHDFAVIVGRDAAHVVVHGRQHRNRLLGHVDAGKDARTLGDAGQLLMDHFGPEMGQVEQNVVLVLADTAAFADFNRHRARHHVARCQVLVMRRVAFHETFAVRVAQNAAFAAHAFGDQAAGTVDAGRVELHELHVLQGETRARGETGAIARTSVRRRCAEIRAAIAAGREHDAVCAEQMQLPRRHVEREHTTAGAAAIEDQIEREIFDHELRIVRERLLIQRVQHRVAGAVGRGAGTLRRRAFAVARSHAAKRALIDLAFFGARERHTVVFELDHRSRRVLAHVLDRVLIAEPVRALDRVVEVVAPVVIAHIAERGGNAALRRDRVRARRKNFGQTDGLQAFRGESEGRAQARAAGANDDHIVFVFFDLIR